MFSPFITAIRTLTIIPIPGKDAESFRRSLPFFPVVGFLLAGVVSLLVMCAQYIHLNNPLLVAVVILLIETWLTGTLHLDGLGDVADAFGSRKSGDEMITVMKDSRMGAFGVCAILFAILLKTVCWYELLKINMVAVIMFSLIVSRSIQPLLITFFPKAGKQSLLNTFSSHGTVVKAGVIVSFIATVALCYLFIPLTMLGICSISALAAAFLFALRCIHKIGGITGDCVGAANEIAEVTVLFSGIVVSGIV